MKTSKITTVATIGLLSLVFAGTHAQEAMISLRLSSANRLTLLTGPGKEAVNFKALRNFSKTYDQAIGAEWSVLGDKSLMCRFIMRGIAYRAFYRANGQWTYTVSGYSAGKLDRSVYDRVKSVFYNFTITYVEEIDRPSGTPVYIVEIQDEQSVKKVRVNEDEIEVIKDLQKQ